MIDRKEKFGMGTIPSPEEFFGFKIGADKKLARWDKIIEYFYKLEKSSDKIKVIELGKTTEGNPFIIAIITSPENMRKLDKIRENSIKLAYSNDINEKEAEDLIKTSKIVFAITNSIHATEVGGTQMAIELAYELIKEDSREITEILNEIVLLLVPCANPDGNIMVVDWYNKWLETDYEGCPLPWLFHKYAGGSINGEVVMMNLPESIMLAKILFVDWFPQVYLDHHQYGSYAGRFLIPPFANPTDQNVDPLVWAEHQFFGGMMMLKLEQSNKIGVENQVAYPGVGPAEFSGVYTRVACWHGICGMLTEAASVKIATPIYIHYHQLQPSQIGRPEYRAQINFPHPWLGGWWHLRDIIEYQKLATIAALEAAARHRETILRNLLIKKKRAIEKGISEPPYAFVIPPYQYDHITMLKLIQVLVNLGVKINKAEENFIVDGVIYPKDSYIIFLSQITRPLILSLLSRSFYHVTPWVLTPEGSPKPGMRAANLNLPDIMGIKVEEIDKQFKVETSQIKVVHFPQGFVEGGSKYGYILDGRLNQSFKAVNSLLKRGFKIFRIDEEIYIDEKTYPIGGFYIPTQEGIFSALKEEANNFNLTFCSLNTDIALKTHEVRPLKTAIYQRYYGGNIDEGWTRWIMEQYGFSYTTVKDKEIKEGIKDKYDILILPSDPPAMITGLKLDEYYQKRKMSIPKYPPEYLSGMGQEGIDKIKEFIESGGTLITLNEASNFALEEMKLPIINVLKDLKTTEFFCQNSVLKINVQRNHQLSYGISDTCFILYNNGPAFELIQTENNEDYKVVASYPDENILRSGWIIGEKNLSRKAALIDIKKKKGRIILFGFSPQLNAQTHMTFKFLFNALIT
jgi:hypothetical protein